MEGFFLWVFNNRYDNKRGRVQLAEQLTKGITQLYYEDGGKEKEAIKSNANQHCWIGWMRIKKRRRGKAGNWREVQPEVLYPWSREPGLE